MYENSSENITILLISSSKMLKNKLIESLNQNTAKNHFSLMNKTIESLKTSTERINVPCLICDYSIEQTAQQHKNQTDTYYVQLVDATDTSLINNLISRSIHKESNKNFQFYINAIIYLYDESSPDTFYYVQSLHTELRKTFTDFITNDNLLFLICNMIDAATIGGQNVRASQENSSKLTSLLDNFLNEFSNIQYVSQAFEDSVLGAKPKIDADNGNKLTTSFDSLIARNVSKIKLGLDKIKPINRKKPDVPALNIRSETESLQSVDLLNMKKDTKLSLSKKIYQGEMQNNLRNGFGIYMYDNKFFRYEGEWKNGYNC
jgi:hypothetical protein